MSGRLHILERSQRVSLPAERVFEFFGSAGNLARVTPPWLGFTILTPEPIVMERGRLIDYRISLRGLPLRWRTRIDRWDPPHRFIDVQVRGPYRIWVHEHKFEPLPDGGTLMRDRVRYALPGGCLGRLAHRLWVRADLERIFDWRQEAFERLLGSGEVGAAPGDAPLTRGCAAAAPGAGD